MKKPKLHSLEMLSAEKYVFNQAAKQEAKRIERVMANPSRVTERAALLAAYKAAMAAHAKESK